MRRRVFLMGGVAAAGLAATSLTRAQAPTFHGDTETVSVYATVVNKYGHLADDLQAEDFEVFDSGKRQTITVFKHEVQPISVVVMIDSSGSFVWPRDVIQSAVEEFIADLLPADHARLGSFSNRIEIVPAEFTADRSELLQALHEHEQDGGPSPLWQAASAAMDALVTQKGRRALLILSDSKDEPDPAGVKTSLTMVSERAEAEEIVVYAVGLGGRLRGAPMPASPMFQRGGGGGQGGQRGGGGRGTTDPVLNPAFSATPDPGLKILAARSGGGYFAVEPSQSLASTMARIADELHHPYVLAFTAAALDGRMHPLKVDVRRAGVTVQARNAYLASRAAR